MTDSNDKTFEECIESDIVECIEWIKRCGFLEDLDTSLSENDLALCLMRELEDGVLPLNILSVLSNKEVDPKKYFEYTGRPSDSQFEYLTNLKLFNKLLLEHFGFTEKDLIYTSDIINGKNFGKFISLLSKLSQSEYALKSGINGFPKECHIINEDRKLYAKLEELYTTNSDIYTKKRLEISSHERHPDEEKIYETLVQHRPETVVTKSKRDMCILEIVESEKNYLESLQLLVQGYKKPLQNFIQLDELNTIFKYVEDLYNIHQKLQSHIMIAVIPNRVVSSMPGTCNNFGCQQRLHAVFIEIKPELLVYGKYCANLQLAQNLVHDMIKTNSAKRAKLDNCQEKSGKFKKFPLSDLLTLPMQRILKYHLLFQTLLKYTEKSHEDYEGLVKAHEAMLDVASFVNDVKRDQEAMIAIDKIQGEMTGIHLPKYKKLSDYGRRQKDGELKVQLESEQKPKQRHVFIFDKMILLAKRKGDTYDFKDAFYLPDKPPETTDVLPRKQEKGFPFKVSVKNDRNKSESIIMYTKSDEVRKQWIDSILNAINNQFPKGYKANNYHFDMFTFPNNVTCHFCKKILSGIFFQGYKCRKTNIYAHKKCIPPPTSSQSRQNSEGSISVVNNSEFFREINGNGLNRMELPPRMNCMKSPTSCTPSPSANAGININQTNNNCFSMDTASIASRSTPPLPLFSPNTSVFPNSDFTTSSDFRDAFGMAPFSASPSLDFCDASNFNSMPYSREPWYVGELERQGAIQLLHNKEPGTFLVRISKNQRRQGELSLSVVDSEPKHMKIHRNSECGTFYIEDVNKFDKLKSLIDFYSKNCLNDYFKLVVPNLKLRYPIRSKSSMNGS